MVHDSDVAKDIVQDSLIMVLLRSFNKKKKKKPGYAS